MDLDMNIEDIEFPDEEQKIQGRREFKKKLETQEPILFEEESMTLHCSLFDRCSKKLVIEKIHAKNKKVQGKLSSELDLNGVPSSKIVQIHEAINESLNMSVEEMENKNPILKEIIKELESALMPPPIFSSPIATMQPWKSFDGTPKYSSM